ncbi:taste receptor type 2 member 104-like [Muntiacus reevesi]|uniref:taste receptor type 2 member 104-like n=1 Tax=Muntiacus reevesi TaxID=9886 RepID=UPI00330721D6
MLNILEKVFMVVTGGEFIIGILGNGFIGLTTCIGWIRNQKLSLVDFILTSLAFARISQLWITTVMFFSMIFYQVGFGTVGRKYIFFCIWILASHSSTWLATCLAVFYFLKIASFSHPPFLCLKRRVNKVVFMLPLNKLVVMFGYMLGMLYPSSHSYVLIFENSQMRKFFLVILRSLQCGLKGRNCWLHR